MLNNPQEAWPPKADKGEVKDSTHTAGHRLLTGSFTLCQGQAQWGEDCTALKTANSGVAPCRCGSESVAKKHLTRKTGLLRDVVPGCLL